ncbi:ferritin-like domain-containing protein [Alkalihalobacterium chitinilyticum]|uniref:Ferritin-like domain-containing protein n=1 Tax=Alkalihalobacterium chitinilyticum TaxID=2980103 RepID=A0ABT5VDJ8_9BACI|nr:ferritin-like domain-containing protein [Alkalihalobacterium chitinilyticum]MDE5413527.1 ferritin-like domain-containing protein [Alkalihalobacterium chitinilyticum]
MNQEHVIDTLNEFLQGQYMGIHAYEHLIERLEDDQVKKQFQMIQQNHKEHAMQVAERIQNLGGTPVDNEGVIGSIQGFMSQFTLPESTEDIIDSAIKGESDYGIGMSEKIVRGDLDPESYQLIEQIFDEDRKHVEFLRDLQH